ncbi:MAG: uroporphyrinogen-III C-methyltransferase [Gemmatimonadota bacterium]
MGVVYLVGAGPGDPGLLTLHAARVLRRADIVFHDALVSPKILELVPATAERIDVGKRNGVRCIPQEQTNRLLIEAAGLFDVVVRLKGGDPLVFGRGGEEALALREANVRFRIVPGITAGLGAAAYAGIPLTHRELASAVTFVTGHEAPGRTESHIAWEQFAGGDGTIVVYMGLTRLREISKRLIAAGRSAATPVAVVESATCKEQRTVTAPLASIADRVERAGLDGPAVIVIGEVVTLREQINWYEQANARTAAGGTRL